MGETDLSFLVQSGKPVMPETQPKILKTTVLSTASLRAVAHLENPTDLEMKTLESCGPSLGVPLRERIEGVAAAIEARYKADKEGWVLI